ncbi:uncharacterized protein VTP21DRAFT_11430 [Calcarisporiella thermophila]|uniref:uncharacterized protein n=1 Tax=Calcarisporiella thermophila TaxID=911321 RepID=UPI00374353AD
MSVEHPSHLASSDDSINQLTQYISQAKLLGAQLDELQAEMHYVASTGVSSSSSSSSSSSPHYTPGSDRSSPKSNCKSISRSTSNTWAIKRKNGEKPFMRWAFFMSPSGLRFQLRLTMLSDLELLLRSHFMTESNNVPVPDIPYKYKKRAKPIPKDGVYYNVFWPTTDLEAFPWVKFDLPTAAKSEISAPLHRNVQDYLFHMYLSDCYIGCPHANRAELLDRYQNKTLPPSLLYSSLAYASTHAYSSHITPFQDQCLPVAVFYHEKAKAEVEDVLDLPSQDTVLSLVNMFQCEITMGDTKMAAVYLRSALEMARSLGMDGDDPNVRDRVKLETTRRIWYTICIMDMALAVYAHMRPLIPLDVLWTSPRPRPLPGESEVAVVTLMCYSMGIDYVAEVVNFPDIDPNTMSDPEILHILIPLSAFIQKSFQIFSKKENEKWYKTMLWYSIGVNGFFWDAWGRLFCRILGIEAPEERLKTPTMRKIRTIALDECFKAGSMLISCLRIAALKNDFCKFYPVGYLQSACHIVKRITFIHPVPQVRRRIFLQLEEVHDLLQTYARTECNMVKVMLRDLRETLDELRPLIQVPVESPK